ncbi:MAG: MFS transporter [Planctomycetes bacterium]|nr:MFS transporter [Planctomycetota bacterium]
MNDRNDRRILTMTIGCFLAFAVFGVAEILKGSTLFAVLDETGYSYSRGGTIVMASYLGFFAATLAGGAAAELGGRKVLLTAASACFLLGMGGYSLARGLPAFLAASFLIGLGCGATEIGANYIIVDLRRRNPGLYLNLLSACFGLGSMLAPQYSGRLFTAGFSWREIYWFAAVGPALLLVFFSLARYPRQINPDNPENRVPPERPAFRTMLQSAFSPGIGWFYLLVFAYVAAEMAIGHWIVEYLRTAREMPVESASNWLSLFFGCIMAGRIVGGFFVERIGYVNSMAGATALTMLAVAAGIYGPAGLAILLPLSGLFFAVILPTAIALISTRLGETERGTALGVLFCFVGLGGMAGPWLAGVVNDFLGLRSGMSVALFFLLLLPAALLRIGKAIK